MLVGVRLWLSLPLARLAVKLARYLPRRPRYEVSDGQGGVSLLILGDPSHLAVCLASVIPAISSLNEPVEIIVLARGDRQLQTHYPNLIWLERTDTEDDLTLIREGLQQARYDWVYLLDTDTKLTGETLTRLLPHRRRGIFALSSQIIESEPLEELITGWTDFEIYDGRTHLLDRPVEGDGMTRGHLYAKVGASLFRRQLLLKFLNHRPIYRHLSAESAEWGFRAWREGYEVLFCPKSLVYATSSPQWAWQDGFLLTLRQTIELIPKQQMGEMIALINDKCPEIAGRWRVLGLIDPRWLFAPHRGMSVKYLRRKFYPAPVLEDSNKPYLLFVSPFSIYPPSHGGAIRMSQLLKAISRAFRVVVLSDEEELYNSASLPYFSELHALHLIGDRPPLQPDHPDPRINRLRNHAHTLLQRELQRLITCYQPQIVQIEYVELAGLIRGGRKQRPWLLTLHDVLLSEGKPTKGDQYELSLIRRYDRVCVCSPEDAALLYPTRSHLVANGFESGKHPYVSSAGNTLILFAGPFRYLPNWSGIGQFLATVYPILLETMPNVEIAILGGHHARKMAAALPCFQQSGVRVYDYIEDVTPFLHQCAVTINPMYGTRGSSLKLIESLAAGRVCVSTTNGARGFLAAGLPSLIAVERIEDFTAPLLKLLLDEDERLNREKPAAELLHPYTWTAIGERFLDILHQFS